MPEKDLQKDFIQTQAVLRREFVQEARQLGRELVFQARVKASKQTFEEVVSGPKRRLTQSIVFLQSRNGFRSYILAYAVGEEYKSAKYWLGEEGTIYLSIAHSSNSCPAIVEEVERPTDKVILEILETLEGHEHQTRIGQFIQSGFCCVWWIPRGGRVKNRIPLPETRIFEVRSLEEVHARLSDCYIKTRFNGSDSVRLLMPGIGQVFPVEFHSHGVPMMPDLPDGILGRA